MKKMIFFFACLCLGFTSIANAETGKNFNWCDTNSKIGSPLYLTKEE